MKICYLADAKSIHTKMWASYFVERNYKVDVISFTSATINKAKVHFIDTGNISYKGSIRNWKYLLKIKEIKNLISDIKPDILHAHYLTSYGFIGALMNFHPYVISAHGSDILIAPRKSLFLKSCVKKAIREADLITSPAFHLLKILNSMGADDKKILTFQYGVDLEMISKEKSIKEDRTIISTRQFEPIYNLELLIRAIPYVIKYIPDANFILIGDGSHKKRLQNLVHRLQISHHIKFLGKISHNEVIKYLTSSSIYVSTSLSDSTSLALLEAMACGSFPVVTNIPANKEWIQDGKNGFLVPVSDYKILAERIIEAIRNPRLRETAKMKNMEIIKEKSDFKKNMGMMGEKYMELLKRAVPQ